MINVDVHWCEISETPLQRTQTVAEDTGLHLTGCREFKPAIYYGATFRLTAFIPSQGLASAEQPRAKYRYRLRAAESECFPTDWVVLDTPGQRRWGVRLQVFVHGWSSDTEKLIFVSFLTVFRSVEPSTMWI